MLPDAEIPQPNSNLPNARIQQPNPNLRRNLRRDSWGVPERGAVPADEPSQRREPKQPNLPRTETLPGVAPICRNLPSAGTCAVTVPAAASTSLSREIGVS